jgi:hypothetical protein
MAEGQGIKIKRLRRVRHSLETQDREDLATVFRRTTRRDGSSGDKVAGFDEEHGVKLDHAVRSFL